MTKGEANIYVGTPIWPEDLSSQDRPGKRVDWDVDDLLKAVAGDRAKAAHYEGALGHGLPPIQEVVDPPNATELWLALPVRHGAAAGKEPNRVRLRLKRKTSKKPFRVLSRHRRPFLRVLRLFGVAGHLARRLNNDSDFLYRLLVESGLRVSPRSVAQQDATLARCLNNPGILIGAEAIFSALQLSNPEAASMRAEATLLIREGFRLRWCGYGHHVYFGDYHAQKACVAHMKTARQKRWRARG